MVKLDPSDGYATLINTFEVEPDRVAALTRILEDATETMRRMPGFISANLHVSRDRTRVVNYAQWVSDGDMQAMLRHPEAQPHLKAAADVAKSFEPVLYTLEFSGGA
jgi:quinol monooxygenase YgiN